MRRSAVALVAPPLVAPAFVATTLVATTLAAAMLALAAELGPLLVAVLVPAEALARTVPLLAPLGRRNAVDSACGRVRGHSLAGLASFIASIAPAMTVLSVS